MRLSLQSIILKRYKALTKDKIVKTTCDSLNMTIPTFPTFKFILPP